jgi:hypothetical protein
MLLGWSNPGELRVWDIEDIGETKNAYKILIRKPDGKKPHGRTKRGSEDNIKVYLKWIACEGLDCIELAQKLVTCSCQGG